MTALRRYEILLPLRFNNGQSVPENLLADALLELEKQFEAVSWETQIVRGTWQKAGQTYHDELMRLFVDVPDKAENRQFFIQFKDRMKTKFKQLDIWLVSYSIDVL